VHKFDPNEESDEEEEYAGLEVNSHWFKGFVDDEEEEELDDKLNDLLDTFGVGRVEISWSQ